MTILPIFSLLRRNSLLFWIYHPWVPCLCTFGSQYSWKSLQTCFREGFGKTWWALLSWFRNSSWSSSCSSALPSYEQMQQELLRSARTGSSSLGFAGDCGGCLRSWGRESLIQLLSHCLTRTMLSWCHYLLFRLRVLRSMYKGACLSVLHHSVSQFNWTLKGPNRIRLGNQDFRSFGMGQIGSFSGLCKIEMASYRARFWGHCSK